MNTKHYISILMFIYFCTLVIGFRFSILGFISDILGFMVSTVAQILFIYFLASRPPANQTIMNGLLIINFCYKCINSLQWLTVTSLGFYCNLSISHPCPFEYQIGRMGFVLALVMYVQLSATRLLMVICPAIFHTIKFSLSCCLSVVILLVMFTEEMMTIGSCAIIHDSRFKQKGPELIHNYSDTPEPLCAWFCKDFKQHQQVGTNQSLELWNQSLTLPEDEEKSCTRFPLGFWLIICLIVFEALRMAVLFLRRLKAVRSVKVKPRSIHYTKPRIKKPRKRRAESLPLIILHPERSLFRRYTF